MSQSTKLVLDPGETIEHIKLTRLASTTLVHLGALSYMFGTEASFHFQDPVKKGYI